ncbi:MAG TPA: hypothetical protein VKS79_02415, partial [Gemmataceae bacterium]|nr:hypothetical protein [Gemmataceae bacterium]
MRKSILIGSGIVFLAGAAGWGWFMLSHPQSIRAIATGSLQATGVCHLDSEVSAQESGVMYSVIGIDPVIKAAGVPVSEPSEPPEVIDLTELQRIPQLPMETVEPPLAREMPAVFNEPMAPGSNNLKPAHHEETTQGTPATLSERQIPADFLQHSADGPPDPIAKPWTVGWLQRL